MLKPYKRISKRELKQDKFVTMTIKAKEYVEAHSRLIMYGTIALLAVIVIVSFLARSKRQANVAANELLGKAAFTLSQGNMQQGETQLKELIDNYSGVTAAGQGCFLLAKYYWQKNDYTNAKLYFEKYLDEYSDDELLTAAAYAGYGDCLSQEGKTLEAAKNYEKAARVDKDSPQTPAYLFSAAQAYMTANELTKAQKMAQEIVKDHAKSEFKNKAEILISMLKMKA
jgi:outer membrane protein assembly factor BamD (BamD/ComL family)